MYAPGLEGGLVAAAEHDASPLLISAVDLAEINPVDSKLVATATLKAALANLPPGVTNWSRAGFPWWVFMAGHAQKFHTIIAEGIIRVEGVNIAGRHLRDEQTRCMRVTTRQGVRVVSVNSGRLRVE